MTANESKLIKQTLKGFVDSGLISEGTMAEVTTVKDESGKPKPVEMVTRKEASKYLKVSQQSIINYEKRGSLKAHKIQGKRLVRYKRDEVEALFQ